MPFLLNINIKLSNPLDPTTEVEYFKLLKDYFKGATNDDYEFDEVVERISVKSKFLSSIWLSSGERYPTRAECFPFGLVLNMVKSDKIDVEY